MRRLTPKANHSRRSASSTALVRSSAGRYDKPAADRDVGPVDQDFAERHLGRQAGDHEAPTGRRRRRATSSVGVAEAARRRAALSRERDGRGSMKDPPIRIEGLVPSAR